MLTAWFYNPASDRHGWMNKLIAMLDAPFCHVELQFPDSTAYTVYMGSEVVKKQRSFNNACYSAVCIPCTGAQCVVARGVADRLHQARLRCSALDMTSCVFGVEMCKDTTFCSKLVAQILHESKLLPASVDFHTVSPSKLHHSLCLRYAMNETTRLTRGLSQDRDRKPLVVHFTPEAVHATCRAASTPVQAIDFRAPSHLPKIECT